MEVHLKTDHKPRELHKCDHCDKEFILKWRLLKHERNHDKIAFQKCHNFNNNLNCLFEEDMGCMLAHEVSDMCKFDQKCTKNLCYYRHTSLEVEPVDENGDADNESGENEVEACDFCGEMFDEIEDLIDHYGTTGH